MIKFVEWSFYTRKLSAPTIKSYVSNIATLHKLNGLEEKFSSNFVLKTAIRGIENLSLNTRNSHTQRKAMTLHLLKILGHEVARKNWSKDSKVVVWSAMCTAFFGSFRIGELLAKTEFSYNPTEILVWENVKFLGDNSIQIVNKVSKNRTPGGEKIDLFPFPGSCCPVSALKRLWNDLPHNRSQPVFRFTSGKLFTQKAFNEIIKECLVTRFGPKGLNYSGHSFRAGLPSALSGSSWLNSEMAIKKWGRWNSNSFEKYVRLEHAAKKDLFKLFSEALLKDDTKS